MRIWFDTEFVDAGSALCANLDFISIGMVREDGAELYLENNYSRGRFTEWHKANLEPKLGPLNKRLMYPEMRPIITEFAGDHPEFWGYYASYDWVLLCKIFGGLMNLPPSWPEYCRDTKQLIDQLNVPYDMIPGQPDETRHHALEDARFQKKLHLWVEREHGL